MSVLIASHTANFTFHIVMHKGSSLVKRKHSPPQKDAASSGSSGSSNEDDVSKDMWLKKKNTPQGKKLKERTSPPTSENDENIMEIKSPFSKGDVEPRHSKEQEEQDENISKTKKSDKQLVTSIEDKMNISNTGTKKDKPKRSMYLFDFLGDEVSNDESQALQALSSFWVTKVARNKDVLKRPPPRNQQEQDFYNKYCDKQGKLSITAATHLMTLPHVVTVCLKNNAQIEVVVSNRERALQESEELHQDIFEVVEAMAMHLM
ncbi:hypothetical protein OS493_013639 [Desmophyllum pertusum]|uniref:Uncharacterized protein n=1 Tax=Desmophyllum pertusum TaxID=174260 RepID=A0A9X0A398_9CNID|nr:hypothetical protein OS493_013639 [Desmophyllum pertusum]